MTRFPIARRATRAAGLAAALTLAASCSTSDILSVEDIDVARPAALRGVAALPTVYFSTIGDFQVSYAGSNASEGHVNITGLITDELQFAETFPTRIQWDRRTLEPVNGTTEGIFRNLMRAQATAELAARRYTEFSLPASAEQQGRRAEIYNLWGNLFLLMAENWCSGVPISQLTDDGEIVYGRPQTSAQLYALALQKFDSAIVIANQAAVTATVRTAQVNFASIGRGRVFMNLGRYADAATAVAGVPVTFRYDIQHSATANRQWNGLWNFIPNQRRWVVANNKGGNGLPFASTDDPRIRPTRVPNVTGFDGTTPMIVPNTLVADRTVPTNVARGVEGRLIAAEVAARNNDASFLTILNELRANTALYACPTQLVGCAAPTALPALADPGTQQARLNLVLRERAWWLYGTAHRLGDFRRLIRLDGRDQTTVFPSGPYPLGGIYGTDVNIPIPQPDEGQNPNVTSDPVNGLCIDRRA
jgi:hypothetical protein